MCVRLARVGHVPLGALALRPLNRKTLLRKVGQWGFRGVAGYARNKFARSNGHASVRNPHLGRLLENGGGAFRSLRAVASVYGFPVVSCDDHNSSRSVARLKQWSPDLVVFAGGNILRRPLLEVPRLGVLNAHLGLLPEVRGMSSPEWSLLLNAPVGVTIHYIDEGIDTGPVLQRCELPDAARFETLPDLRDRLIAFGVEKMADVVAALDRGTISAKRQFSLDKDNQFFVMHEGLQALAAQRLGRTRVPTTAGAVNG
jgi:methionyl-tRNA formyltransferase